MKQYTSLVLCVFILLIAPSAFATLNGGPWNQDDPDTCPTYESCSIIQNGYSPSACSATNVSCYREQSYSQCLPYKVCVDTTWNAQGKVTRSKCEASGERSCAYSQDNPYLCATLYVRRADCSRQN
jgi:hypothetical protein